MADRRHFGDPAEKGRHWWFLNIKESAAESKRAVFPRGCCPFAESHRKTLGDTVLDILTSRDCCSSFVICYFCNLYRALGE
ncbi:hypothetical protein OYC64_015656 [Pagothenia borchgrevinki]|uniref:Uncharacterized protein n=1 Tax=Pagothenia borchgrevinki TaxID=8213 RepID=A0ABD2HHX1_PAGBO